MIDKPFSNYLNIFLWSINWLNGLIVAAVTVTVELSDRLNVTHWAHTGLQHRLELSGHADLLLFLADDSLDGGGEAAGVAWEDQGVAVVAASILLQGAAGVRDGVVVVVRVDDPVVVTWKSRQQEVSLSCVCVRPRVCVCVCEEAYLRWTGSWPGPGSSWTSCRGCRGRAPSTEQPCRRTQPRTWRSNL